MSSTKSVESVGVVGATGAVGMEMIKVMIKLDFPAEKLRLFGNRSAGTIVPAGKFGDIEVEPFSVAAAQECNIVLLAVSGSFAKQNAPLIQGGPKNTVIIDNSSAFRYNDDIPLVIPEINSEKVTGATLIANPNCTTAIAAMVLWPLHQKYKLRKIIMSTYQAASGAGIEGMKELEDGVAEYVKTKTVPDPSVFQHPLPFNVIPHIDAFQDNGYTKEEMKVSWEMTKICSLGKDVKISCTAVRVPTLRAHSEAIVIETEERIDPAECREYLRSAEGVTVVDDPANGLYPLPAKASGDDNVHVGRIRSSLIFGEHGIEFFVSGDQLLRGAALNAVLIAQKLL
eukprot:m.12614 g.12614  ORF g.12614 m.12614 type:complete len:341 (+) comp4687_c0_seq2:23-1045(+)